MTEATHISQFLPALAGAKAMDSLAPSTGSKPACPVETRNFLSSLPERLDDNALATVDAIAAAVPQTAPPCTPDHFLSCLRSLSILPRKVEDDCSGEQRAKLYARMLGHHSAQAMSYLTQRALETCKWFPTIAECLEILKGWKEPNPMADVIALAWHRAQQERRERLSDFAERLRAAIRGEGEIAQSEIDALSERAKFRLCDMMLLWRLPSGRYGLRKGLWADAVEADRVEA